MSKIIKNSRVAVIFYYHVNNIYFYETKKSILFLIDRNVLQCPLSVDAVAIVQLLFFFLNGNLLRCGNTALLENNYKVVIKNNVICLIYFYI